MRRCNLSLLFVWCICLMLVAGCSDKEKTDQENGTEMIDQVEEDTAELEEKLEPVEQEEEEKAISQETLYFDDGNLKYEGELIDEVPHGLEYCITKTVLSIMRASG